MSRIQNVSRKDGTYYFRRVIRLGNDNPFRIRLSLKTMIHARAKVMAPALSVVSEAIRLRMTQNIGRDGLSASQRAEIFKRQMLRERDRLEMGHAELQLVDQQQELPEEALRLKLDACEAVSLDRAKNGEIDHLLVVRIPPADPASSQEPPLEIVTWEEFENPFAAYDAKEVAREHLVSLGISPSKLALQMATKVVHQARVEAVREYRDNLEDPGAAFPRVPVAEFSNGLSATAEVRMPLLETAASSTSGVCSPWSSMTPSEAALKFIEFNPRTGGEDGKARRHGPSWTSKTRDQFKLPALLLGQVMEGRPLAAVTQGELVRLNDCFNRLHGPSFRKSERQRGMTILEIVSETETRVKKGELSSADTGLGIGTTNRHWGFLRQLTTWFQRHQSIADLDYSAFIVDDDRDPRTLRDSYSVQEGRSLFSLAPWTGSKSLRKRMESGNSIVHDACYFVPLIAWYTGLRRGEICGLELADLVEDGGEWHFNVRDNSVRKLKTRASQRLVPLAPELVRLGLPGYADALRNEGETLMFPELVSESGRGSMGDAFYKRWWTKLAVHLDFLEPGQAMHSFRHTLTDELKAKSVFEEVRADLVGHRIQSETGGRYSKAARLTELRKAVAEVPEVTTHLQAAPLAILPASLRRPRRACTIRKR
ncbi:site-specific integrase [Alteraurantiacibacter aquimixticola]|uniref:Site-specific integrase n=1 Tax=Alteraurantiacibacter aquimixticola TaxID=2489173 RepID=A0A4T3F304_9SPHN|nr:site-specific integrase [Alteraurantiacibacter aquimixticola]TIX50500.1 site-specific integrase [Alteraurantiacibacter aquimixticola]